MVEHRTVNARVAGSSPAFRAMKGTWYRGCAPDSKSGYVGSNPAVPANWRVCGSDNVGIEACGAVSAAMTPKNASTPHIKNSQKMRSGQ